MINDKNRKVPINKEYFNKLHDNSLKNLIDTIKASEKKFIIISHFPPL